jgi:hypothetical protein
MLKRTPLFAAHQRAGGKLIEFGGWEMPVQYSTITDEHLCVRRAAALGAALLFPDLAGGFDMEFHLAAVCLCRKRIR